jgi:hypothetical protein
MPTVAATQLLAGFQPHKGSLPKVKNLIRRAKAWTLQAPFEATTEALQAVSEEDARGFFEDCGYETLRDHPL